MKAVCINDSDKGVRVDLTYEKAYEVIEEDRKEFYILPFYKIIDDDGKQIWHQKYMFMPLEEWRDLQLNEILKEE